MATEPLCRARTRLFRAVAIIRNFPAEPNGCASFARFDCDFATPDDVVLPIVKKVGDEFIARLAGRSRGIRSALFRVKRTFDLNARIRPGEAE